MRCIKLYDTESEHIENNSDCTALWDEEAGLNVIGGGLDASRVKGDSLPSGHWNLLLEKAIGRTLIILKT